MVLPESGTTESVLLRKLTHLEVPDTPTAGPREVPTTSPWFGHPNHGELLQLGPI
jgi:hypothetical protein